MDPTRLWDNIMFTECDILIIFQKSTHKNENQIFVKLVLGNDFWPTGSRFLESTNTGVVFGWNVWYEWLQVNWMFSQQFIVSSYVKTETFCLKDISLIPFTPVPQQARQEREWDNSKKLATVFTIYFFVLSQLIYSVGVFRIKNMKTRNRKILYSEQKKTE